ncbi:MAG: hypothetical protein JWL84_2631, partial [Rhodospirillales bacterium]|nr:hypothetical protein [Rhodospirillales bacterium]
GLLGDLGGILVNILDPINFVPVLGWGAKAGNRRDAC